MSELDQNNIERFSPTVRDGLNDEQVLLRQEAKLTNETNVVVGKTVWEIIKTDVLSYFNILLFIIAGLMIFGGYFEGLFFLVVIIPNMFICLYEDLKSRSLMRKLKLSTAPQSRVIRNGSEKIIPSSELVLDDIVYLTSSALISVDGTVQEGTVLVNESALTGESNNITKNKGDMLYSGTYVVSGECYMKVEELGNNTFVQKISAKAKEFKRSPSEILKSLKNLYRVICIVVTALGLFTVLTYVFQGKFNNLDAFKKSIGPLSGSLVAMIPSGLYLLTSSALAVTSINLSQRDVQVQDFYSIEMLARCNVLCVDKTGTITDGSMEVVETVALKSSLKQKDISQIIVNLLAGTKDNNLTAQALSKYFDKEPDTIAVSAIPFTSENKYSAVTLAGNKTYVLGASEFLTYQDKQNISIKADLYASKGFRVLLLCSSSKPIVKGKVTGTLSPLCLIILRDHIREGAIETFKKFIVNKVDIKVISGDNALTVSQIAIAAGIKDADNYISLEKLSDEQVYEAARKYTVFGRVSPEQKDIIVTSLKEAGKTVAMTGDGINDILALKKADCSIAMRSGSQATQNVSHIVLTKSDFNALPEIVFEGRRVINNLQRTGSLYLSKTFFAFFYSLFFLIASLVTSNQRSTYPFVPNNLYLWEILTIGIGSFFLAFEPNREKIGGHFLNNILIKAIPCSIMMTAGVGMCFLLYQLHFNGVIYTGVSDFSIAVSMAIVTMSILALAILFKSCAPMTHFRRIAFIIITILDFAALTFSKIFEESKGLQAGILGVNFANIAPINYLEIVLICVVVISVYYILAKYVYEERKSRKNED